MQSFTPGQPNTLTADMIAKAAPNDPITSGTVIAYLKAMDGDNAGKWWDADNEEWSATKASAGSMEHDTDGHWEVVIAADAWIAGVRYRFDAKESGNLHVTYSEEVVEIHTKKEVAFEATITG